MKKLTALILGAAALALAASPASAELKKKYKVATEGAYAPFNWVDPDGSLKGFDVDIANELCARIEVECEIVAQDWDGIIPGLLERKYDMIVASMSITEERKKKVDFTQKYQDTPARLIAKKGSGIDPENNETMKGKTIGVQVATIHEKFARKKWGDVAEIKVYDTVDNHNLDLANGRLDMVMADSTALDFGFLKTDLGKDFEFVGPGYDDPEIHGEGAGIALRKGEDELREALNNAIQEIRKDGTYQKIQSKYFDYDVYGSET
ncbi:MAG TPA: ABC transporter substrate-binding protein [Alphaproteobacteria bacterium]|nr:ABC transporter substrate-binding protein [Alphaproteobacteria bacterium]